LTITAFYACYVLNNILTANMYDINYMKAGTMREKEKTGD